MAQTDLSKYDNSNYNPGAGPLKRVLWFYVNAIFLKSSLLPINRFKVFLLRSFGAKIGKNLTIKPRVNIKYPWNLTIGNETWIGENVWIDSIVPIIIGNNVCVSQGALLLTGGHNYQKSGFDLIVNSVVLEDGVWIGAKAIVNNGVTAGSHSVLASGSVTNQDLEPYFIYQGNPASKILLRVIE